VLSNLRKLVFGNGLAQGLQLLSLLVLSRIYQPSDFGLLAQVQSIATLACIVATLQLHLTIPLASTPQKATDTALAVQALCVAVFVLSLPAALYFGKVFVFSAVLTLFLSLSNTYTSYLVFKGSFGAMSRFYVARAVLIVGLQMGFSVLPVPDGLLWGFVLAEGCAALYLRCTHLDSRGGFQWRMGQVLELARRYKSFSVYGTAQELMSVCAFYAPLLLFTRQFGEAVGGQYAMASRLVWAPVVLVSSGMAQVLYHGFCKQPPTSVWVVGAPVLNIRVVVGLLLVGALAFSLQDVVLWGLGPQWVLASQWLPLQLLWGAAFLMSTPFRVMFRVLHLQKVQLAVDAATLGAMGLLFALAEWAPLPMMWALAAITVTEHALLAACVVLAMRHRVERP
jgi:teichuronic acid exporter